jgi:hypothetical protein
MVTACMSAPAGLTNEELRQCCFGDPAASCNHGIDPYNHKTIKCDPGESLDEGSEGPN